MKPSVAELNAGQALLSVRRERVHNAMLIEILVLLVFLAMAFAFVRDNEHRFDSLEDRLRQREQELVVARREIARLELTNEILREENAALERSLRRFIADRRGTINANDRIIAMREETFQAQIARLSEAETIVRERQIENASLRDRLRVSGRGGTDLPPCTVASGRFIARIDFLGDGSFRVAPRWQSTAAAAVAEVPSLAALASNRTIGNDEFKILASQVQRWGRNQAVPCGFYVEAYSQHSQLDLYKRQYQAAARYFYVAMR